MAAEPILTYKKPGFPRYSNTEKSFRTTIDYIGPTATIEENMPDVNAAWGDYVGVVINADIIGQENSGQSMMTVVVEYLFDSSTSGTGTKREETREIEWVMFQRPLLEHPVFRAGGTYALIAQDHADIIAWQNEPNPDLRALYQYNELAVTGSGDIADLSDNAKKFCEGIDIGQEVYEDYAPVIRVTSRYVGGTPGASDAGKKDATPPSFTGVPSGYEWRKSADRAINTGGQTRWDRVEEWIGAIKVLSDKDEIYW